ncbi:hypothetical protein [Nocardia phage NBR1]|uniref:minor tail protein n=1 Tax=Nocardia phage NBR1 TaxID=1109711 RepID=UPI00023EEDE3|nr:minor tail protein [Nocardia phage NBR1]AEV52245.1 hypothetical protein [Nocardia phage NBR1]
MTAPLAGQSGNMIAAFGALASKQDVVDATGGITEDIGDIYDDLDGFGQNIDSLNGQLGGINTSVQGLIDGRAIRQYWESMNKTEEATFPRALLQDIVIPGIDVQGSTGSATAGSGTSSHSHSNGSLNVPSQTIRPVYTPSVNSLEGGFIRMLYDGGRAVVTYIVDAVTSPCELYVVVARVQSDGDIEIVHVSPNQTPLITTSRFERSYELPSAIVYTMGNSAFVGIHQRGAGNVRPLFGIRMADIPRANTLYPPQQKATFSSSGIFSAGTVIPAASMVFPNASSLPYLSLGQSLTPTTPLKLVFYETFDSGTIPLIIVQKSAQSATVSSGVFVVNGTTDGIRRYIYGQSLNYDNHAVSGQIRNPSGRVARLYLRHNPELTQGVALTVLSGSVIIDRVTGSGETFTALASQSITVNSGDELRLKAEGFLYTAQRRVAGVWTDLFSYNDAGGVIPIGESWRYTGLGNERQLFSNGGGWDYFRAEDL